MRGVDGGVQRATRTSARRTPKRVDRHINICNLHHQRRVHHRLRKAGITLLMSSILQHSLRSHPFSQISCWMAAAALSTASSSSTACCDAFISRRRARLRLAPPFSAASDSTCTAGPSLIAHSVRLVRFLGSFCRRKHPPTRPRLCHLAICGRICIGQNAQMKSELSDARSHHTGAILGSWAVLLPGPVDV